MFEKGPQDTEVPQPKKARDFSAEVTPTKVNRIRTMLNEAIEKAISSQDNILDVTALLAYSAFLTPNNPEQNGYLLAEAGFSEETFAVAGDLDDFTMILTQMMMFFREANPVVERSIHVMYQGSIHDVILKIDFAAFAEEANKQHQKVTDYAGNPLPHNYTAATLQKMFEKVVRFL